MKAKILILIIMCAVIFGGCARSCEELDRRMQSSNRTYHIQQYSGGVLIREYKFTGILNNQENSDGYYFSVEDTLIEIGGDIIIKSVD